MISALQIQADDLVTRNVRDYQPAPMEVIQPVELQGALKLQDLKEPIDSGLELGYGAFPAKPGMLPKQNAGILISAPARISSKPLFVRIYCLCLMLSGDIRRVRQLSHYLIHQQ